MQNLAIDVVNLSFNYGTRPILDSISFQMPYGKIFCLTGPNGSGKSTLFKLLSTLLFPKCGDIFISGLHTTRQTTSVRREIGVLFQHPALDKKLTVYENLSYHADLFGIQKKRERILDMLSTVDMLPQKNELVKKLSGGQKRRVEIAKALLPQPKILLMDEALSALDPVIRKELWAYFFRLKETTSIFLISHLLEEGALSDYVLLLKDGKILKEGKPDELIQSLGGSVVTITTKDNPTSIVPLIQKSLDPNPLVIDEKVLFILKDPTKKPLLFDMFSNEKSILIEAPSLEDYFIFQTKTNMNRTHSIRK